MNKRRSLYIQKHIRIGFLVLCLLGTVSVCQADERSTAKRFDNAKADEPSLIAFLKTMPKGGDLHVHVGGATYVDYALDSAMQNNLFYDPETNTFAETGGGKRLPAADLLKDEHTDILAKFLDAASMRGWKQGVESGHDHFFDAFTYVSSAEAKRTDADVNAEIIARALGQKEQYIEIMARVAPNEAYAALGDPPAVDDPEAALLQLAPKLDKFVQMARAYLDEKDVLLAARLRLPLPVTGAQGPITVRYIVAANRLAPDNDFFMRLASGMALMKADKRVVGVNILAPEDHPYARLHFNTQMRLLDALWKHFDHPNITLHAGELTLAVSPPETMRSRIRDSIEKGHARRIGHGVSIAWEDDLPGLLREMRDQKVGVEICLTSNASILGVEGSRHPFPLYRKAGIAVSLNTDDEGISRTTLTMEFVRAVRTYDLAYADVKTLARCSLANSFLSGDSLFVDANCQKLRPEFADVTRPGWNISTEVQRLLDRSEKMRVQLRLEQALTGFENEPEIKQHI